MGTSKKRGNYENYFFFFYLRSSIISITKNILPYFEENKFITNILVFAIDSNMEAREEKLSKYVSLGAYTLPTFTLLGSNCTTF
jgi:hypothetical protein